MTERLDTKLENPTVRPWGALRVVREDHKDRYVDSRAIGNATAVFLEGIFSTPPDEIKNLEFMWHDHLKTGRMAGLYHTQVKDYFFFDIYEGEDLRALSAADHIRMTATHAVGIIGAIGAATAFVMQPRSQPGKVTRRAIVGGGAFAALSAIPLLMNQMAARRGEQSEVPVHTERDVAPHAIFFRNLLFAHKLELVANQLFIERGEKVDVAAIVGKLHGRLPTAVSMDFHRRSELIKEILRELRTKISADEFDKLMRSISTIPHLRIHKDGRETAEILTIPPIIP